MLSKRLLWCKENNLSYDYVQNEFHVLKFNVKIFEPPRCESRIQHLAESNEATFAGKNIVKIELILNTSVDYTSAKRTQEQHRLFVDIVS